jgi:ATP-dependent Zn protease
MTLHTRLRSTTRLHRVAIHEAGHGVAAVVNRLRFDKLTIIPEGDAAGHLAWGNSVSLSEIWSRLDSIGGRSLSSTVGRAEERIVVSLAGLVAERKFAPQQTYWRLGSSDRENADSWLQHMIGGQPSIDYQFERGPAAIFDDDDDDDDDAVDDWDWDYTSPFRRLDRKELRALRAKYRRRAAVLIDRHWADVEAVARALLEQKTLSYAQTRKLVTARGGESRAHQP